jgi:ABC-type branched-subunit amino acid transport system substrate-binding protein
LIDFPRKWIADVNPKEYEMIRTKHAFVVAMWIVALTIVFVTPLALAAPPKQARQPLNIGVIGPFDGPTAEGVTLALRRFSAQGVFTTPDGVSYTLSVITADANTPQQVTDAIAELKKNKVIAIFGPNDDKLVEDSMSALQAAGIPIFTDATATAIKGGGLVFRTRAADNWRMAALADYITSDLKKTRFAIYQGDDTLSGAVRELVSALDKRGSSPPPVVIPGSNGNIEDSAKALADSTPDAVIAFGDLTETAALYITLRGNNYEGLFVTPNAALRGFVDTIPEGLRDGIYGVTAWSYSLDQPESADFLRDYVALFGNMPTALSASAYDTAVALAIAIKNGGTTPDEIRTAILNLSKEKSLQGIFNPTLGNNDLSASVSITVTNLYGAPVLVARYEDTGRVAVSGAVPTNYPTTTPTASPTPQGVVGTMKNTVNVRTGPGENYQSFGQLKQNEQHQLIGASADFKWYVINFRQQQGWLSASLVTVFGDVRSLPVIAPPPTPIPSATALPTAIPPATATPIPAPLADLVMVSAAMNPSAPQSGQPFSLVVTIRNQGNSNAGTFAVAASFLPGEVYSAATINDLAAGAQTTINLNPKRDTFPAACCAERDG